GPAVAAEQVTITSYGGTYQAVLRKVYFDPFSKASGVAVTEDEFNGEAAKVRAMVKAGAVSWDVVDSSVDMAVQLCGDGILEKIDWKRVRIDRSKLLDADK